MKFTRKLLIVCLTLQSTFVFAAGGGFLNSINSFAAEAHDCCDSDHNSHSSMNSEHSEKIDKTEITAGNCCDESSTGDCSQNDCEKHCISSTTHRLLSELDPLPVPGYLYSLSTIYFSPLKSISLDSPKPPPRLAHV